MRTTRGKRLVGLLAAAAAVFTMQTSLGAAPASAAGIQCRDLGNGVLCLNARWPNGDRYRGTIDVWYDKRSGTPVKIWKIGYYDSMLFTDKVVDRTVSPGGRVMEHWGTSPLMGQICWTPYIWYYPPGNPTPQRLDGVKNCFG